MKGEGPDCALEHGTFTEGTPPLRRSVATMAFRGSELIVAGPHPCRHHIREILRSAVTLALSCGSALGDDLSQTIGTAPHDLQTRLQRAMRDVELLQMRQQGLLEEWRRLAGEITCPNHKSFHGVHSPFNDPPPLEWAKQFACTWVPWNVLRRYDSLYSPWLQWCTARGLTTWLHITDGIIAQFTQDLVYEAKSTMHTHMHPATLSECVVQCLVDTYHVTHVVDACVWGTQGSQIKAVSQPSPFRTPSTLHGRALYVPRWHDTHMGMVLQDPVLTDDLKRWCERCD